jgi:hypothetical protein
MCKETVLIFFSSLLRTLECSRVLILEDNSVVN